MFRLFFVVTVFVSAAHAELTVDGDSEDAVEQPAVVPQVGNICVTSLTKKQAGKTAKLVCAQQKKSSIGSTCSCKDTLHKSGKSIKGKIAVGAYVPKKVASVKMISTGPGGICYQMPKYMGSKGETAWYCSDDSLTGYESKAICEMSCVGI